MATSKNIWTIDSIDTEFNTLAEAKSFIGSLNSDGWREFKKAVKGKGAIRHWVNGEEVSIVFVQGKQFFTRVTSVENAKKHGIYYMPIQ